MKGGNEMDIMAYSDLLLIKLYRELVNDNSSETLTICIDVEKYSEELEFTENQTKICLCYLIDAGYIKEILTNNSKERKIVLTAKGIQYIEPQIKE